MDYDALAKQAGATNVDYDALAQQAGASMPAPTAQDAQAVGQKYRDLFGGGARKKGAQLPSAVQGLMSAMQGPTFGFADEIAGAGAAFGGLLSGDTNIAENYRSGRDLYRGGAADFQSRNPGQATLTQLATSAPVIAATGGAASPAPVGMVRSGVIAAKAAAPYGALSGAGNSEASTVGGIAGDAAKGAASSAVVSGVSVPVARSIGSVGGTVASAISDRMARSHAKEKVAEALARDASGTVFQNGTSSAVDRTAARLGKLGHDATIVDAAGTNAAQTLDVLATAPGQTKSAVERLIRARQAARGGNIVQGAKSALGVPGNYVDDMANFTAQREMAAAPLYAKAEAEAPPIVIPRDILLRDSVKEAYAKAQKLAAEKGVTLPAMNPNAVQPIPPLSLKQADFLKRAMDDVLFSAKAPTNNVGKNQYGAMMDTRSALVAAIDDQAGPAYAAARSAFAGPTRAMEAAEMGRNLLKEDAALIPSMLKDLGESEREALKIGTVQAIKDMTGTQAGQTKLLKMWANPGIREKLQMVFGKDFRSFAGAVLAEEKKKGIEQIGRGSQTAARQIAAQELDNPAVGGGVQAVADTVRNPFSSLAWLADKAQRIQTPEKVRDEMGRILLSSGPQGQNMLRELSAYLPAVNAARAARADAAGRFIGVQAPSLLVRP